MTVTYTSEISTQKRFGTFFKLLFKWRGSVYRQLWKECLLFTILYFTLNIAYRFGLTGEHKTRFESFVAYCDEFTNLIPLSFVLGFYVSVILSRWWDQWNSIPWPDKIALFITCSIHGHDQKARQLRRTIMRYLNLAFLICLSSIDPVVKKRFPTFRHMERAGFMSEEEYGTLRAVKYKDNKYFVPIVWAAGLVSKARKENYIRDDMTLKTLKDEIATFRGCLGSLFGYDEISIPLVYTQVVTLAVYTFFLACLIGRQIVEPFVLKHNLDLYVPVFTYLQFLFYVGWLKVAESLSNPFGEDDEDFEINTIIDRNIRVSLLVVDEMHEAYPALSNDKFWDTAAVDINLPYTIATIDNKKPDPKLGSAADIIVPDERAAFVEAKKPENEDDNENNPPKEMNEENIPMSSEPSKAEAGVAKLV